MNRNDRLVAFSPVRRLISSGNFFKGGSIFQPKECVVVTDYGEALNISRIQYSSEYIPWLDVRESHAVEVKGPSPARLELSVAWEEEMFDEVTAALPEKYSDLINDVEGDLFNCCSNIFFERNNGFYKRIFEGYENGFWPCGVEGPNIESGRLILFDPRQ